MQGNNQTTLQGTQAPQGGQAPQGVQVAPAQVAPAQVAPAPQQNPAIPADKDTVPFGIDFSGYKKDNNANPDHSTIRISSEKAAISIDVKPDRQEAKVENGNDILKNPENEIKPESVEKKEALPVIAGNQQTKTIATVTNTFPKPVTTTPALQPPVQPPAPAKFIPPVIVDGFKIDEELFKNPEEVKQQKGKGDAGDAKTGVYLLLDKLFRKLENSKKS